VQLLVSLAIVAGLTTNITSNKSTIYLLPSVQVLVLLSSLTLCITLVLFVLVVCAWIFGSKGAWKRGIKDLHKDGLHGLSIFGHRRPDDDDTRTLALKPIRLFRTWLPQTVYRRIEYVLKPDIQVISPLTNIGRGVESVKFAMARNITAIILVSILTLQSVRLFLGVVNDPFDVREIWGPFLINYSNTTMPDVLLLYVSGFGCFFIFPSLMQGGLTSQESSNDNSWAFYSNITSDPHAECKSVDISPPYG
jgi:hypothetical protein